jgi:hypothetical protein
VELRIQKAGTPGWRSAKQRSPVGSSDPAVSTALMTAVEAQQPGYLSHSDAAAAPLDRFPQ